MSILNDRQISELAQQGMITPFIDHKVDNALSYGLEPFGYTLRTSFENYKRPMYNMSHMVVAGTDKTIEFVEDKPVSMNGKKYIVVPANNFVLCSVVETLALPTNIQAQFLTKSTLARLGLFANVTWIDAGWRGVLTVEMANLGKNAVAFPCGEGIGQLVFYRGVTPESSYSGRYQNQSALPQEAIVK